MARYTARTSGHPAARVPSTGGGAPPPETMVIMRVALFTLGGTIAMFGLVMSKGVVMRS